MKTKAQLQHTPTPWAWWSLTDKQYPKNYDLDGIIGADGTRVLTLYGNLLTHPNTDRLFIVRACNAHDALVDALEAARDLLDRNGHYHVNAAGGLYGVVGAKIDEALTLAKEI